MAPGRVMGHLDPSDLTGLDEIFERRHHRSAGAAGFLGISAPADLGGGGRPPSFRALYLFEAAYHDAPSIDTAMMLCGPPLLAFGDRQQQARWVPPMVRGEITGCIAYTEPGAGSDLAAISSRAIADGPMWVLNGRKALVTGAHKADMCVTVAVTDASVAARRAMSMCWSSLSPCRMTFCSCTLRLCPRAMIFLSRITSPRSAIRPRRC